jgi:hypothetical protein
LASAKNTLNLLSPFQLPAIILVLLLSSCVFGSTFDDYQTRVEQSVEALDTLVHIDETETPAQLVSREQYTIAAVRSYLPARETVEWNGERFEIQNQWVHDALDRYQDKQGEAAEEELRSLTERLASLAQSLTDAKLARESKGIYGTEASDKLKEILSRQEFATKRDAGTAFERLWRDLMRWLSKLMPKRREMSPGSANIATLIAQLFVIAVALVVIVYVFWKLVPRFMRGRGGRKKTKSEPRIVLGEKLAPDESALDLLAEAEALAKRGELRAAIRKAYIALLVELGERKVVSLAQYKTNRDYLRAVRKTEPLYTNMKTLTESFERHWYGFAGATENDWTAFRATYHRALAR